MGSKAVCYDHRTRSEGSRPANAQLVETRGELRRGDDTIVVRVHERPERLRVLGRDAHAHGKPLELLRWRTWAQLISECGVRSAEGSHVAIHFPVAAGDALKVLGQRIYVKGPHEISRPVLPLCIRLSVV